MNSKIRIESDSIGEMDIPADAYYGVQSMRAKINFGFTERKMNPEIIKSLAKIKKAAAVTNLEAQSLDERRCNAICDACDEIISGKFLDSFIVDAIQGGAGTSANMNANEVIANRAIELLGGTKGDYSIIHPNDHVNMAQSTNDVYPSSGKIAMTVLLKSLIGEMKILRGALLDKSMEFDDVLKMGRTQLQDAVPMRLGQEFHAYMSAVDRDIIRLNKANDSLHMLNMGATAIGSAINVSPYYLDNICVNISKICGENFSQNKDLFDGTSNLDCYPEVSGALKTCAINLSKMCNDLRLMSSGPRTGLNEINLPAMQNGSSIMPGKVNPVIPEVVTQTAFRVIGSDVTVTLAAEAGQLELNAFEPVIFYSMTESIECLTNAVKTLVDHCILGITANKDRCRELLNSSVGVATALCPHIGYKKSAELAKKALKTGTPLRDLALQEGLFSEDELNKILDPVIMTEPHHMN